MPLKGLFCAKYTICYICYAIEGMERIKKGGFSSFPSKNVFLLNKCSGNICSLLKEYKNWNNSKNANICNFINTYTPLTSHVISYILHVTSMIYAHTHTHRGKNNPNIANKNFLKLLLDIPLRVIIIKLMILHTMQNSSGILGSSLYSR